MKKEVLLQLLSSAEENSDVKVSANGKEQDICGVEITVGDTGNVHVSIITNS